MAMTKGICARSRGGAEKGNGNGVSRMEDSDDGVTARQRGCLRPGATFRAR